MSADEDQRHAHEAIVSRAVKRAAEGWVPPLTRLPTEKEAFPKLLCLDLNKWVDLAKSHYGRKGGEKFSGALSALQTAIAAGKIIVPITAINAMEVAEDNDHDRRERLARFMVQMSANQSLIDHVAIRREELKQSISRLYQSLEPTPIRSRIVRPGIFAAITGKFPIIKTGDPLLDRIALLALYDEAQSVSALVDGMQRPVVEQVRANDLELTRIIEAVRNIDRDLNSSERRILELRNLLSNGSTADVLDQILIELELDVSDFRSWLNEDANLMLFTDMTPSINVVATLMLERDLNKEHRTHRNDGKDFSFFKLALPYANLVIAEKSWSHFAKKTGLAKLYRTIVSSDVGALPVLLAQLGCL